MQEPEKENTEFEIASNKLRSLKTKIPKWNQEIVECDANTCNNSLLACGEVFFNTLIATWYSFGSFSGFQYPCGD